MKMKMQNKDVILSGVMTGISGLFARLAMMDSGQGIASIQGLLISPYLWLASICGMLGFAYLQIALHRSDLSFVEPAVSSIAIITPVILAVILLDEFVPVLRWVGVGLLLIGVIGIDRGEEESLIGVLTKKLS